MNPFASDIGRPYGAIGTRLFFLLPEFHYTLYSSLFIEYTSSNELKIGITLDPIIATTVIVGIVAIIPAIIYGISKLNDDPKERDRQKKRDREKNIWWEYIE
jgi:hypothetical protein